MLPPQTIRNQCLKEHQAWGVGKESTQVPYHQKNTVYDSSLTFDTGTYWGEFLRVWARNISFQKLVYKKKDPSLFRSFHHTFTSVNS